MTSETPLHALLQRQLRKFEPSRASENCSLFIEAVNQAYCAADQDRILLERSLELASQEHLQRNQELAQLLNANPDLCIQLDAKGRILAWYGQSKETGFWGQLKRMEPVQQGLPDQALPAFNAMLASVLEHRQAELQKCEIWLEEQQQVLEARCVPFGEGWLLMIRNTTAQHAWEKQLAERNRELLTFHMLSEVIMTSLTLKDAYERIVERLQEATEFEDVAIEIYDPAAECMIMHASTAPLKRELPLRIPLGETLSGLVVQTGLPLIETHAWERAEYSHPELRACRIQTFVCIPLKDDQGVIGALCLGSREQREVPADFIKWMSSLAQYLSLMIQRKEAALKLIASKEEAEAANRAKSEFLANMSHEMRTPLNGVLGMARLLLRMPLTPNLRQYVEVISQSGMSLLRLIEGLLDFSQLQAYKLELRTQRFSLLDLLEQLGDSLALMASEKQIELMISSAPDVPEWIQTDRARLEQVLINLLSNALKFTQEGTVELRIELESVTQDQVTLRFEVQDTGIGIQAEHIEKIFEPFVQVDTSSQRHYGGVGLGLSIAKRLVKLMSGQLSCSSMPGEGAVFCVSLTFPLLIGEKKTYLTPTPLQVGIASRHDRLIALIKSQLAACKCDVQRLAQPAELNPAEAETELVLLDWNLYIENPQEWIDLSQTQKVVLLAYPDQIQNLSPAARAGFICQVNKPLSPRRLSQLLSSLTEVAAESPLSSPALSLNKGQILLVEDNPINQMVAQAMLEHLGYQVELAGNGLEALEVLGSRSFDLVLMDCQMPEMDGYEATRRIRQGLGVRNPSIPVIALTAHCLQGDRQKCLAAGMDDFLTKPVNAEVLDLMLHQWICAKENPVEIRK